MAKGIKWSTTGAIVGAIVYKPFQPQIAGKITKAEEYEPRPGLRGYKRCTVQWSNGEVSEHDTLHLNDFRDLVETTERKAIKHRKLLEKAEAL